ncbi:MAG: hypothetical protein ACTHPS_08150, partial [Streptosporangiaceae bacterium]
MLQWVLREVGLEIVSEPEAACREDRGPDARRPGHFLYFAGCGRGAPRCGTRGQADPGAGACNPALQAACADA